MTLGERGNKTMDTEIRDGIIAVGVYFLCFITSPHSPLGMNDFLITGGLF